MLLNIFNTTEMIVDFWSRPMHLLCSNQYLQRDLISIHSVVLAHMRF